MSDSQRLFAPRLEIVDSPRLPCLGGRVTGVDLSGLGNSVDGAVECRDAAERAFDWCKVPASKRMQALVGEVRKQLLHYEARCRPRKRKRRKADQDRFDRMVSGLVCELVHSSLQGEQPRRRITLSKDKLGRKNVSPEFVTEILVTIVKDMVTPEMDWVELEKGTHSPFDRVQSTICASERLLRYATDHEITLADIGRDVELAGDPIELRSEKVKGEAELLDMPLGEPAATYRGEMVVINQWLAEADIICNETSLPSGGVDETNRRLKRIFNNGSLEQGGRLYGGFWSPMSAEQRLRHIRINNEPVVELDYGQCAMRIAYGRVGVEPPEGDLYSLPRIYDAARYRAGIKMVVNAMFFHKGPLSKKPQGSAKKLPKNYNIEELQALVHERHRPIASLFHVGFGMEMQFIESQVLVRCLLAVREKGLVALPVHDCLLVPESAVELAKQVMLDSFRDVVGVEVVVEVTRLPSAS